MSYVLRTSLALALAAGLAVPAAASAAVPTEKASVSTSVASAAISTAATNDSFFTYTGSKPLSSYAPGAVLDTRTIKYSVSGIKLPINVVQILYRTTDMQGRPSANVTSVLKPPVAKNPERVVAYGSMYDSLDPKDGPSYTIAGAGTPMVHIESLVLSTFLAKGNTIVMADTEGATANFMAGPEYGYTTLDSMRAVLATPSTGVPANKARIGLVGYSGGSIATNWAAALAPTYAPEINKLLVGAAEGGVLVNPATNLDYISGSTIWAGVLPMAFIGVSRALDIDFTPYLNDYGKQVLTKLKYAPITDVLGTYSGLTWKKLAKPEYANPASIPEYPNAVNKLNLGLQPSPTVPMFIGQGTVGLIEGTLGNKAGVGGGDGVMVAGDVRTLARQYCSSGTNVKYTQYPLSHFTAAVLWIPQAISWIDARLKGTTKPVSNCGSIAKGNSLAPVVAP